jgi:hypothetical protein
LCMLSIYADTQYHLEMLYGNTVKIITLDGDATIVICTIITMTLFVCKTMIIIHLVRFCEVLYINLCTGHAKIFINLPLGNHENIFGFSDFHVGLPPKLTGYRCVMNGLPIRIDCTDVLI